MGFPGLKRGTVRLVPHQEQWKNSALKAMILCKNLLGDVVVETMHIGSTAVPGICAKPVIDVAVGVRDLEAVKAQQKVLEKHQIIFRGEDVPGQLLWVKGDFERDTRTHHIHVLRWNSPAWVDYLDFRDFLTACPEAAASYERVKIALARQYPDSRAEYTAGKAKYIARTLRAARKWRRETEGCSRWITTPLGKVIATASRRHLLELSLPPEPQGRAVVPAGENTVLDRVEGWLSRYFSGEKVSPAELPLAPDGTDFQRLVWQKLLEIPYGETVTYGDIARVIAPGRMSPRAVGNAVGANPVPIIIPCHRVLAANGLGGFSCGVDIKQKLLKIEGIL